MGVKSSRKWLLTINNPLEHNFSHNDIKATLHLFKSVKYWCLCDEIGKNNTYHTHVFLYSPTPIKFETVHNRFPGAHIDFCRGTALENRDYIRKEGKYLDTDKAETNLKDTFEEFGDLPDERQGQRNDLNFLYECIKNGMSNYDILELNPGYLKDLDKIDHCRQIVKQEEFKNQFRHLDVTYQFGKSGTGKSRNVMERFGYENVYRVTDWSHPFDNYKSQDVIIFEEFFSSCRIQDMLNYLDGYPLDLPCRYNNKTACFTKVYINSNIALENQYTDIQHRYRDTWLAFIRRITCVKEFNENGIKSYENIDDFINRWHASNVSDNPFLQKEVYHQINLKDLNKQSQE